MSKQRKGLLVLEDGSTFVGHSMGADGEQVGEVVFNTSMTGYQEIITDPSYWGQMVVFTCPHIGNVGVNEEDVESDRPYVRAVLARKICTQPSNWRSQGALPEYLKKHGVPALSGLDTRRLTLLIREKGVMRGALSTVNLDEDRLLQMARSSPDMSTLSPVQEVSRPEKEPWIVSVRQRWMAELHPDEIGPVICAGGPAGEATGDHLSQAGTKGCPRPHIIVIDCGTKQNILRLLAGFGARVTVVPAGATAEEIMAERPDGVLISNGPGDPDQALEQIATARELMRGPGPQLPMFGLCLGHQIIALAAGARRYKLPFGHHGGNHPVQELASGRIEITAQNHNYAIDPESLEEMSFQVTHINLYDGTVEGMRHTHLPIYCVQYHPEASPGPHDSLHLLREFVVEAYSRTTVSSR